MSDDNEYMSLAPGFGIVPESQRNAAYKKLGIKPGEGGLHVHRANAAPEVDATLDAFLAGVATGADPKALAAELRAKPSGRRGGRS